MKEIPKVLSGFAVLLVAITLTWCDISAAAPALYASPQILQRSGDEVKVSWLDISPVVSPDDFITLYVPENRDKYIAYRRIGDSTTWTQGYITFPIFNMRQEWRFGYHQNSTDQVILRSNSVTFANFNEPTQIHLSLTNNPNEMRIMWVTKDAKQPCIEYGLNADHLSECAMASSATYTLSQLCTAPANKSENFIPPGLIHNVLLEKLDLNTEYHYRVGDCATFNDANTWSKATSFITSPGVGKDIGIDVAAYGDLGVLPPWKTFREVQKPSVKTVNLITKELQKEDKKDKPTLAFHIGDISYARGYAYLWDLFFGQIEPIASRVPYMVCIGNHEYDWPGQPFKPKWGNYGTDSGGECGIPYDMRFHMTGLTKETRNLWYSFDYGNTHFVFMSTEHDFLRDSMQWKFLEADLRSVDRSKTPFVVFLGHRPMYTTSEQGSGHGIIDRLVTEIEPLLMKYKVNLCLWGHVHQYERTCGMSNYTCAASDNDAPVHVIIGMAGHQYQVSWGNHGTGVNNQPDWSIFRTMEWGYTRLRTNSTHLHLQFLGVQRGNLHDEFWLQ